MRTFGSSVAMALMAVFLTGCSILPWHRSQQAQAPPLETGQGKLEQQQKQAHQGPPPSGLPQPSAQTTPPQLPPAKQPKVKRAKKKKHSESTPEAERPLGTQPAAQQTAAQQAAASEAEPPATSPIGQLTTGDDIKGSQVKKDTLSLIAETEDGLKKIKRPLSAEEKKTAEQIRTFLKQARQALDIGDSDGAQTLATKAKLLLDELNKT